MIKNVIFDMDGVLLDSECAIRMACIKMLKQYGVTAKEDDFIPFTGMGEIRFIGGVCEKYGIQYEPVMKDTAYRIYGETAAQYVVLFNGVKELVLDLRAKGYKLAVASAADAVKVHVNLQCMGLGESDFDAIVTGSDVTRHKPDPMVFLMAAQKIGADPAECVVVEDAVSGCMAAKAAKMSCVGVLSTFAEQKLLDAGADYIIPKTADLPQVLAMF